MNTKSNGKSRFNRISPAVWTIGVTGIAATIFFAWIGSRQHRATVQPEQPSLPTASTDTVTPRVQALIRSHHFDSSQSRLPAPLDEAHDNAAQIRDDHALKGIVTTAEGVRVAGASVAALSGEPGKNVWLQESHFRSSDQPNRVTTSDDQGAFSLSSPPEHGTVVALADAGFASVSIDEVRATPVVVLQAFGRIEGTLKIAGAPGVGQDLAFDPSVSGLSVTGFNTYKATTDDHGHFAIEKIPPGKGSIFRVIKLAHNASAFTRNTPVTVQSGQTTQITLGDSGAVLRGSVQFESPATNGERLILMGHISRARPKLSAFNSMAEAVAYMNSPEGQAKIRNVKNYSFAVNADGTFQADSVSPGTYTIEVSALAENYPAAFPIALGSVQFTVPDDADPLNPIGVGEIRLISTRLPDTDMLLKRSLFGP